MEYFPPKSIFDFENKPLNNYTHRRKYVDVPLPSGTYKYLDNQILVTVYQAPDGRYGWRVQAERDKSNCVYGVNLGGSVIKYNLEKTSSELYDTEEAAIRDLEKAFMGVARDMIHSHRKKISKGFDEAYKWMEEIK